MSVETRDDMWIIRRDGLIESFVGSELVGLHIDSGYIFGFNATASRVWQLLEQPKSLSSLCSILRGEYAIDAAACEADVRHILDDLRKNDLVALS
jgi:hypothetical protein